MEDLAAIISAHPFFRTMQARHVATVAEGATLVECDVNQIMLREKVSVPAIVECRLGVRPFRSEDRSHGAQPPFAVSRRGLPREMKDKLPDWTYPTLQR